MGEEATDGTYVITGLKGNLLTIEVTERGKTQAGRSRWSSGVCCSSRLGRSSRCGGGRDFRQRLGSYFRARQKFIIDGLISDAAPELMGATRDADWRAAARPARTRR